MKKLKVTPKFLILAGFLAVVLPASLSNGQAQAQTYETFRVNGNMALNTNNNFRRIDGQPRIAIWQHNVNDGDQQFQRLPQRDGTVLLRQRSTGKCLNAYRLSNGSEVNVWDCNSNDPDQKFVLTDLGNSVWQIKRNGTNLCIDSPTRSNGGIVHLWDCNPNNANQRWQSSRNTSSPPSSNQSLNIRPTRTYGRNTNLSASNGYRLAFQNDGNLVLYRPDGRPIWATGTVGPDAHSLKIQSDGNVVLYNRSGTPMWATNTVGNPGAYLSVQADGNLVVYNSDGSRPLFATNTVGGVATIFNAAAVWGQRPAQPPTSGSPILDVKSAQYFRDRPQFYMQAGNGYAAANYGSSLLGHGRTQGNCTWYAYGRLKELGFNPGDIMNGLPNANQWTPLRNNARVLGANETPRLGDVAQWYLNGQNHVAIVEKVENGRVYLSESHYVGGSNGILHSVANYTVGNPHRYIRLNK